MKQGHPMRRADRLVSEEKAREIMEKAEYGIIMTADLEGQPYGVAVSHVVDGDKVYFHCAADVGRKIENIKQDGEVMGNRVRVKVIKNKVAPPFREAEFDIVYGKGISKEGSVLDLAVNLNIIEKAGSWFSYNGEKIGQGRENIKKLLSEDAKFMAEVEKKVRDNFNKAFENALGETEIDEEQEIEPDDESEE